MESLSLALRWSWPFGRWNSCVCAHPPAPSPVGENHALPSRYRSIALSSGPTARFDRTALRHVPTRPPAAFVREAFVIPASSSNTRTAVLLLTMLLTGCGTPAAKDFSGRWKPVNRFQASTTEIPLNQPYTYYASPTDETLRNMLMRWATDTGMTLVYRLPSDYTLFAPVSALRTTDIEQAASGLSSIYAAQAVSIIVAGGKLEVVRSNAFGSRIAPAIRQDGTTQGSSVPASTATPTGVR